MKGGAALLDRYGHSVYTMIQTLYPEYDWKVWRFKHGRDESKYDYFADMDNQRKYLEDVGMELGVTKMEDWYGITMKDVLKKGMQSATFLNEYYQGSLIKALQTIYSHYPWQEWRFGRVSKHFWNDISNQKGFLESIAKELNIKQPSDWYQVDRREIIARGGDGLIQHYGTLERALQEGKDHHYLNE